MIRRPTWITLVVFLLLLMLALLWPRIIAPEESVMDGTPTPEAPWVLPFSELVGVKVENFELEKTVELQKGVEGQWKQISPTLGLADNEVVVERISWLASPVVERELPAQGDLAQFGLDEPKGIITVTFMDGSTQILLVGDTAITGSTRYVVKPNSIRILLLDKFVVNSVMELVDGDWLLPPLPEEIEPAGTETLVP